MMDTNNDCNCCELVGYLSYSGQCLNGVLSAYGDAFSYIEEPNEYGTTIIIRKA